MSVLRDTRGAAPIAELARLDSDMHHVREQADIDRRTEAAFRAETRAQLQHIEQTQAGTLGQLMRVTDLVNRLDVQGAKHTLVLDDVARELAERRGGLKIVAGLAVAVPLLLEVARHVWR